MLQEAIYSRLTSVQAVSALVSTRVYPRVMPQNVKLPAIAYQRTDEERFSAMTGDIGIVRATLEVSCWGTTFSSARDVAAAVRGALQRYRGTVQSVEILDGYVTGVEDLEPDLIDGVLLHCVLMQFSIHYRE